MVPSSRHIARATLVGMCGTWVTAHTQRLAFRSPWYRGRDISAGKEGVNVSKFVLTSADGGYGSDRRLPLGASPLALLRGGEAILRDRYRLGHLSVVLLPNTYVRWLNVQSGHSKLLITPEASYAFCDRTK